MISVYLSEDIINDVRSLQTIYSLVFIRSGLSPLNGRGVSSVSLSVNLINDVRSLQKIYSAVRIGKGLSPLKGRV